MQKNVKLASFGLSDIGLSRPNNEDAWVALPEKNFFALADGMGGHQAGEIAAQSTINLLQNSIAKLNQDASTTPIEIAEELKRLIESTNQTIYEMSRKDPMLSGMGTTLCCLLWTSRFVLYAHVGDSRIYRLKQGKLEQLTQDHSLYSQWMSYGIIAERCETPFPYKNVITKAIGTHKKVKPEIGICSFEPKDLFLLCSDGLSDVLSEIDIQKILERSETLELAAFRLIEKAKIKGSNDNITVLLVQCLDEPENIFRQQRHDTPRPEDLADDHLRSEQSSGKSL